MEEFKVGQVVRTTKGDGPAMIVNGWRTKDLDGTRKVECFWWEGSALRSFDFDPAVLKPSRMG